MTTAEWISSWTEKENWKEKKIQLDILDSKLSKSISNKKALGLSEDDDLWKKNPLEKKIHFPCWKVRRINCTWRGGKLLLTCNKAGGLIWIFPLGLLERPGKFVGLVHCNSALSLCLWGSWFSSSGRMRIWLIWRVQQEVICCSIHIF